MKTIHIYQRKFTTESLQQALANCNWYLIGRRPAVRVDPGSARPLRGELAIDILTRRARDRDDVRIRASVDLSLLGNITDFRTHVDGTYFSFKAGSNLIHGDAWALSVVMFGGDHETSAMEVLYVGQARDVLKRLGNHETLQKIYEDHHGQPYDIFVAPVALQEKVWMTEDEFMIEDDEFDLVGYLETFSSDPAKGPPKPTLDLVEHALISYFKPEYNGPLKEWNPAHQTKAMKALSQVGFRNLNVHLDGWSGLVRFHSSSVPARTRSHLVKLSLPPGADLENRPRIPDWGIRGMTAASDKAMLAAAEKSSVALTIFGPEAPNDRAPDEYYSDRDLSPDEAHPGWTKSVDDLDPLDKEELRVAGAFFRAPAGVRFERRTGLAEILAGFGSSRAFFPLTRPRAHEPISTTVIGDGEIPDDLIVALTTSMVMSRLFRLTVYSTANSLDSRLLQWRGAIEHKRVQQARQLSRDLYRFLGLIFATTQGHVTRSSFRVIVLDGVDELLEDDAVRWALATILQLGPSRGYGCLTRLRSTAPLEIDDKLTRLATRNSVIIAGSQQVLGIIEEVRSEQEEPRPTAAPRADLVTFVLQYGPDGQSVGQAVQVYDCALSPREVIRLANADTGVSRWDPKPWHRQGEVWSAMDPGSANRWHLTRHRDVWLLSQIYSHWGCAPERRPIGEAMLWANSWLSGNFGGFQGGVWSAGLATGPKEAQRFYFLDHPADIQDNGQAGTWLWLPLSSPLRTVVSKD